MIYAAARNKILLLHRRTSFAGSHAVTSDDDRDQDEVTGDALWDDEQASKVSVTDIHTVRGWLLLPQQLHSCSDQLCTLRRFRAVLLVLSQQGYRIAQHQTCNIRKSQKSCTT